MPLTEELSLKGLRSHLRLLGCAIMLAGAASVAAIAQTAAPPAPTTPGAPDAPDAPAIPPQLPNQDEAKARAAAVAAKANIDVDAAWTRATSGNAPNADVYVVISSAKDPDRLMDLETAAAAGIRVERGNAAVALPIDIPAGGTVQFSPTTEHLVLTGLKAPLREGESLLVTFHFDKAGTENAAVKVLAPNANGLPAESLARRGDTTAEVTRP
jgi:periplasmic copper chaperone A